MNKRGQIYIIIAVVIIGVIAGLLVVSNYVASNKEPVKFYDLSEELGVESEKVINYGVYNSVDTDILINNFTDTYSDYFDAMAGKSEMVFAYGNETKMNSIIYSNVSNGRISVGIGEKQTFLDVEGKSKTKTSWNPILLPELGNYVLVNVTGSSYKFVLNKGENFFFVLTKKIGNDTYVTQQ